MISRLLKKDIVKNLVRDFMGFIIFRDKKFKNLIRQLSVERKIQLGFREMWNLYISIKKTKNISGDIAELGVYSGGSAKLICETKNGKPLYLFDTFSGIPDNNYLVNKIKSGEIRGGSLNEVKDYLAKYDNIFFYEGIFPGSAIELKNKSLSFSFVHLDADIYEATLDGLEFFYPLMVKDGIILIHDYQAEHLPGVKKAVDEFLKDKPEKNIGPWCRAVNCFFSPDQAIIIKK